MNTYVHCFVVLKSHIVKVSEQPVERESYWEVRVGKRMGPWIFKKQWDLLDFEKGMGPVGSSKKVGTCWILRAMEDVW